jgi:ABC-2 type transport system ATP-binding protein
MPEPALRFSGVAKSYGRTPVLRDLSFEVGTGEFLGLVGVNGAGKTTLLKSLLDFCEIDAGSITIFGTPHTSTVARSRLAFLPERFVPPYYLTGKEFIRYVLDMQAVPYSNEKTLEMLARFELEPAALKLRVRSYSKGMTQKLGLVASLLADKDLYIFDEPASGLDPKARALFKAQLRVLKAEERTMFFTSHALADVDEICDRMAVIHAGTLRFAGTPAALCERHAAVDLEQAFLRCIE